MRFAALLLLALASAAAAMEAGSLHTLGRTDKGRTVCHDLEHRKHTLKLIKVEALPAASWQRVCTVLNPRAAPGLQLCVPPAL